MLESCLQKKSFKNLFMLLSKSFYITLEKNDMNYSYSFIQLELLACSIRVTRLVNESYSSAYKKLICTLFPKHLRTGCTTFCYCRPHYFNLYEVRPPRSSSYIYEIHLKHRIYRVIVMYLCLKV